MPMTDRAMSVDRAMRALGRMIFAVAFGVCALFAFTLAVELVQTLPWLGVLLLLGALFALFYVTTE